MEQTKEETEIEVYPDYKGKKGQKTALISALIKAQTNNAQFIKTLTDTVQTISSLLDSCNDTWIHMNNCNEKLMKINSILYIRKLKQEKDNATESDEDNDVDDE